MKNLWLAIIAAYRRWNIRDLRAQQAEYLRRGIVDNPHLRGIQYSLRDHDRSLRDIGRLQ